MTIEAEDMTDANSEQVALPLRYGPRWPRPELWSKCFDYCKAGAAFVYGAAMAQTALAGAADQPFSGLRREELARPRP